jgi:putative flippase GtrA
MVLIAKIKNILLNNKFIIKFGIVKKFKFLFIGGTTFIINYITLFIFKHYLKFGDNLSFSMSFFLGIIYHFSMNKFFVFEEKKISVLKYQIIQYIILTLVNYCINMGIINLLKLINITIYLGFIISTLVTLLNTYFVMNKLIFKKKMEEKNE